MKERESSYQLKCPITLIGDGFVDNLVGISDSVVVQPQGRVSSWELRKRIKEGHVDLNYPVIVILVGGYQILTQSSVQIVDGVESLLLTLRNKASSAWILLSTVLYRPKDETLSKAKIDQVNHLLMERVQKLSAVGCRCMLIRTHQVLVSPRDNKILRPIHVYFQDGLIPSKQAGYLLIRYFVVCALEIGRQL